MHNEPDHLEDVQRILRFWAPGVPAFAFGSRVHGQRLKPTSDLDLCLHGDDALDEAVVRRVRNAFEVSDIPFKVDVIDWWAISDEFRQAIAGDLVSIEGLSV